MFMCAITDLAYGGGGLKMFSMARPKKWWEVLRQNVSRTSRVHYLIEALSSGSTAVFSNQHAAVSFIISLLPVRKTLQLAPALRQLLTFILTHTESASII